MGRLTTVIIAAVVCIIVSLSWAVNYYRDNAITYKDQRDKVAEKLGLANDTITDMQTRQRNVAALDAKYTGELQDAKATIDQLERDVANGKRRLQLNAGVQRAERPAPAAWAMLPAPDLQTPLNGIISPSESESSP